MVEQSLERIIPENLKGQKGSTGQLTLDFHLERYEFAKEFIKGDVLDIACGVGYGCWELANNSNVTSVTGVDLDENAIQYARKNYSHEKIRFDCHNAYSYSRDSKFDSIVSLETIEHLESPAKFIRHITDLLKPGGTLICSVPISFSTDINPFHLQDFSENAFKSLFEEYSPIGKIYQRQSYNPITILSGKEVRSDSIRKGLATYYLMNPKSFLLRIRDVLTLGFVNIYLVAAWKKMA